MTTTKGDIHRLAAALEIAKPLEEADAAQIAAVVGAAFRNRRLTHASGREVLDSTDALLDFVAQALPSWSLHLNGASSAVRERWTCTIRETGVRDDDELIGVGKAEHPARAIGAAFLKVIALRGADS